MTSSHRGGQRSGAVRPLRSRDTSGFLDRLDRSAMVTFLRLVESVGEPVWACGPTAAALHGFDGFAFEAPFHLVVPRGRFVHRVGHYVHTSRSLERIDVEVREGIPVTTPTRTVIDLGASEPTDRLTAAIDSSLRDRGTSEDFLHRRIVALRRQGRAGISATLRALDGADAQRGGHSWLEREFLRLCVVHGVPRPDTQRVVGRRGDRIIRVDCQFPGTRVVVELLGYRFHRSVIQMQGDAERMNRMVLDGLIPLQFTYTDVVSNSAAMMSVVLAAVSGQHNLDTSA